MTDCLYRSENLLVRAVPAADTAIWLVTFDNHAPATALDRPGFGEAFLAGEGFSAIHVLGRGNDWYQYPDMPQALAAVRAHLGGASRIVAYGSSMGGYAAIRFGGAIGAQAALALSPQYSNDPAITPWETRWLDDAHRIRWVPETKVDDAPPAQIIVLFDPAGPDARHAALIARRHAATLLPLRHTGHPVATFLHEIGLLRPLVCAVRDGSFDPAAFQRQTRTGRAASSVYLGQLALAQPDRRAPLAVSLAERACRAAPLSTDALQTLGWSLSRAGRHEEAIAVLEEAVRRSDGQDLHHLYWLAEAFKAAGRRGEALAAMARAVALAPDQAHLWVWHAYALARVRDFRGAIARQAVAVKLAPRRRAYRTRLAKYRLWHVLAMMRAWLPG